MYWYPKLQEYDPNLTLITCQQIKISFIRKTAKQKYLPQENYFSSKTQTGEEGTIEQAIQYHITTVRQVPPILQR